MAVAGGVAEKVKERNLSTLHQKSIAIWALLKRQ